jgi:hypothetical protein
VANRIPERVFGVADMTGDGKSEIVFVDPDYGTIYWATSESDYGTSYYRNIGNERMVFF